MRKTFMRFSSLLTLVSRGRHIMVKRVSLGILLAGVLIIGAGRAAADTPTGVTCGSAITAPGQYFLMGDCSGAGITITASDVHLKLMGHTMTGSLPFVFFDGVSASNVSHVHIEGPGTITNYNNGVNFVGVSDSHVEQVNATANRRGLYLLNSTTDTHVNNNVFSMNVLEGVIVDLSSDNHLNNNQTIGNGTYGIDVANGSTGNHVNGNTALGNGLSDLFDGNTSCDNNKWNGNTFVTSNQTCIH